MAVSTSRHLAAHRLRAQGLSLADIGAELGGISRQAVFELLQRPVRDEEAMLREVHDQLAAELAVGVEALEALRRRVSVLRRRMLEIDDRIESRRIDRILGF